MLCAIVRLLQFNIVSYIKVFENMYCIIQVFLNFDLSLMYSDLQQN